MPEQREAKTGRMTLNLTKLIKTLGESLYSDPTVALRELIQNANDSCVHRESEDAAHRGSAIHVKFDAGKRTLVVQDNGSGMTWEEAEEFLTVIGNSRTEEVREYLVSIDRMDLADRLIGRFGLGLLSAFIIGDRIEFLTLSYKPGSKPVWWECDGGQDYRMSYSSDAAPVGTSVTVHVGARHIGLLNESRLAELIRLFGDLLQVPIYLDPRETAMNAMTAPWDNASSTPADYRKFLEERFPYNDFLEIIPVNVLEDAGAFSVKGVLFIPRQAALIVQEYGDVVLYVRRMLIRRDERELLPAWARFVRGIVDTPSLNEVTSRGAVARDGAFERVQAALGDAVLNHLQSIAMHAPARLTDVVSAHNIVIKAWSLVSSELFDCVKDLVLFNTDAGRVNLTRYFQSSQSADIVADTGKRFILYYTNPAGPGTQAVLFSARGLHVIDASRFPDEAFLRRYAVEHPDVEARPLDIAGSFIFEEPVGDRRIWLALEQVYEEEQIGATVVKFEPADIPAVLIVPEGAPVTEQVDALLNDAGISDTIKDLIRQMYEENEMTRRRKLSSSGTLYVNSRNPIMQSFADLDIRSPEMRDVLFAIYHNALMLSAQGSRSGLSSVNARRVFEANTRTIVNLLENVREVRRLKSQLATGPAVRETTVNEPVPAQTIAPRAVARTKHVTCFVALPFIPEYDSVIEALRDVLETAPYYWEVARADQRQISRRISQNVAEWMARAHCYAVEISELNANVMMELGFAYWAFQDRPLILLRRTGSKAVPIDLGDTRYMEYAWGEPPDRQRIAEALRLQIAATDELTALRQPGMPKFLSTRTLQGAGVADRVIQAAAKRYVTVETFLSTQADKISAEIGVGRGIAADLQNFVRDSVRD